MMDLRGMETLEGEVPGIMKESGGGGKRAEENEGGQGVAASERACHQHEESCTNSNTIRRSRPALHAQQPAKGPRSSCVRNEGVVASADSCSNVASTASAAPAMLSARLASHARRLANATGSFS
jgi:hypothetical protein